ncbi:cytochrome P450 [Aspergillus germanicus]
MTTWKMAVLTAVSENIPQIGGVLLISFLAYRIYNFITDPLLDIPGPFLARFTRLWLSYQYATGQYERTNIQLHKRYGRIVRIAPNQYSIDGPSALKVLYGHGSQLHKGDWYLPWGHPAWPNLFNVLEPRSHGAMRRKLAKAYAMSSLVGYEPYVNECTALLKSRLGEIAAAGKDADMGRWFQLYAFDVIGQITFSRRFGLLESGNDIKGFIKTFDFGNQYSAVMGVFLSLHDMLFKIASLLRLGLPFDAFIDDEIRKIKQKPMQDNQSGPIDFVTKLLQEKKQPSSTLTDLDLKVSASANILAGSDTTSISLSGTLYYLIRTPTVLAKLRGEIKSAKESGKVSSPITFQEARALPFLDAVIKESLRLHPAAGFTYPRVVPPGGMSIAGRYFPERAVVGVNPWVAHRNPSIFGADASEFRPERWINNTKNFGQGARTCIGKNISLLEMYKVIPEIVQTFDFEMVTDGEWKTHNAWFVKPVDFRCRVKTRGGSG